MSLDSLKGDLGMHTLRFFGGTPNRDPCSFWGLMRGHPRGIGVIYGNGIKGPY